MAQPGRPAAIAGNGVDRGGQCCNRVGIKARAIEPAPPSGLARRRQREQGGVAWPMTSWPRRRAVRISEPRMASSSRHEGADRAEQSLGDGELAGIAGTSAQAGDQRHRALPARHHGGQRDKALAPQERRAIGFGRVVEADCNTGRLGRAPGRQRLPPSALSKDPLSKDPSITAKHRRSPISRRTIRHSAEIRPSSRNRSSIQW
jgi:hypothetical protein